jgi:nucleoid-associated protein YgaU
MASQADVGQALHGAKVNVSNLQVKDIGGTTAVYGSVATEDDKRKAEQAIEQKVGKISNHIEVQAALGGLGGLNSWGGGGEYTVKAGDTLSKIAKEKYGNASEWKKIHAANADLIKDPDKIQVGWKLRLP